MCSGSVRPGAACPCAGLHLNIGTCTEISWAGSNPFLNTFYFVIFLMGTHYRLYWWWCRLFSFREVGFMERQANRRVCSGSV